jgi:hypothetical protein
VLVLFGARLTAEWTPPGVLLLLSGPPVVAVIAPARRNPGGAPAVPTAPWSRTPAPSAGLVPLLPGVSIRVPSATPVRRSSRGSTRLPRGTARAIGLVFIAFTVALVALREHVEPDCATLLAWSGSGCTWRVEVTAEAVGGVAAFAASLTYAVTVLWRAAGHRRGR